VSVAVLIRRLQGRPGASGDDEAIGRCERGALTAALSLGSALGVPVVGIAVGPARREDRVLAMALRGGANRAVRISDDGLDELDYFGLAQVLAAAATWVQATVVLCGDRSEEEGTGAIGPAVAELLGAAHLTAVANVKSEGSGSRTVLLVDRVAGGERQRFRVETPAVLCMRPTAIRNRADDEDPSRGPSRVAAIEELDLPRLGLDLRALGHRKGAAGRLRPVRGPRRALVASSAEDLVARLRADHLVPAAAPTAVTAAARAPRAPGDEGP
jgi:electron transfer flavoprotein beta subunit